MFFLCPVARYVWHVIKCTFNLQEIPSVFYGIPVWISKLPVRSRGLVACGVAAEFGQFGRPGTTRALMESSCP